MASTVKENFFFNLINTVSGLLFPLITFPYASRVMMADGIGLVNFYQSIISYIILLSSIGIPLYSIREIARVRDDIKLMGITATEILVMHVCLCLIGYIVALLLCLEISQIQNNIPLFLILCSSILFNAIGCEWFYQGIEEFRYIAIRSLFIKCIYVILLFLFVKQKEDIILYGALTILGTVGNNLFNFFRLKKYIKRNTFTYRELHPTKHLKPALKVFALNLVVSLYVNLNPVMLGFMVDVTSVGLFTAATKISHMMIGFSIALQNAVLPRTSNILQVGDFDNFRRLTQKVLDFIFLITIPLSIGLIILSPSIILVLCGNDYSSASLSLAIQSPLIFVISLSGLFGIQMLYPQGKEKIVICATALGAIVNLILDFVLIPFFSFDGASVATLIAEMVVTISMLYLGRDFLPLQRFSNHYKDCLFGSVMMGTVCCGIYYYTKDWNVLSLIVVPIVGGGIYCMWLFYKKNSMFLYFIEFMQKKIK